MTTIDPSQITGLVLAGGRGSRMGGVDKGLQNHRGMPLALHAMLRLQPQVGELMINANRNLGAYEAMGVPVWPDVVADYAGPLAGVLSGLEHCATPYMVTVPCDSPNFPTDLVARLAGALIEQDADIAMAAIRERPRAADIPPPAPEGVKSSGKATLTREDGEMRTQPVFCLLDARLLESLAAFLQSGERKIDRWTAQHRCTIVEFDDAAAFFNANTLQDLNSLRGA